MFSAGRKQTLIAALAVAGIGLHLGLLTLAPESWRQAPSGTSIGALSWPPRPVDLPLLVVLVLGGAPLVVELLAKVFRGEFGSDLLAGLSIITAVLLGEYLAGALVVLMLSGGEALEAYAVRSASSVLDALAKRMPSIAHRRRGGIVEQVSLADIAIGDEIVVPPHEISPVDGTVIEGHGVMDESYLTGEPYMISKAPGAAVLSGAINGDAALTIRAEKLAVDSRYAKIMQVMHESEQRRPKIRRLADQLGAWYTPLAVAIALVAWLVSGHAVRFLAVLVIATPCPLLIAIPVAIIGSISLSARRGIIVKDPAVLEKIGGCTTAIFDKTGTLTYGKPRLIKVSCSPGFNEAELLGLVANMERYSRHPLAAAILEAAKQQSLPSSDAVEIRERPGQGLAGAVDGRSVEVTNRAQFQSRHPQADGALPPPAGGMECIVAVDGRFAGVMQFRDEPRQDGASFIHHLRPKHAFRRVMLISGDRETEVRYLADRVGIKDVYFSQSPEQKLGLVREETKRADTVYLGDGINDAPALAAATVGVAFGKGSDITAEAAGAVILDNSLERVDELLHIGGRMRSIALQSAVGGMALSVIGMIVAAAGYLPPVVGAILQEVIDVAAVINALRAAIPPRALSDY